MREVIKFAQFIYAHQLSKEEVKDGEYLETLYSNFKENYRGEVT